MQKACLLIKYTLRGFPFFVELAPARARLLVNHAAPQAAPADKLSAKFQSELASRKNSFSVHAGMFDRCVARLSLYDEMRLSC